MLKKLLVVGCLLLSGCAGFNPEAAGPFPENWKEIVKSHIERTYFDPYSLRSVSVSTPHEGVWGPWSGYRVCLECNAKNRMGGYIGLNRQQIIIAQGSVIAATDGHLICNTPPYNNYTPWPEMEGK